MREHVVTDDFGRRHRFTGEKLVSESTDSIDNDKPQWLDVNVWRTAAGSFVVERVTHYRIRHTSDRCSRADGYELIPATVLDTYPCPKCNKDGVMEGGCAQADRITVEAYTTPQELIDSFKVQGKYNLLARAVLADVSEQDERVDALWNEVVVP